MFDDPSARPRVGRLAAIPFRNKVLTCPAVREHHRAFGIARIEFLRIQRDAVVVAAITDVEESAF